MYCGVVLTLAVTPLTQTFTWPFAGLYVGGCGKSTLATVLFNRLSGSFAHSAFVKIQQGDGVNKNAQHLVAALEGLGATGRTAEGVAVLSSRLRGFVKDKKVLLVLDNVWTSSQLTALLPTAWGRGSTVIVTSRSAMLTDSDVWHMVCAFPRCACLTVLMCSCWCPAERNVHYSCMWGPLLPKQQQPVQCMFDCHGGVWLGLHMCMWGVRMCLLAWDVVGTQ
jgi:hypothetical protein